MDRSSLLNIHRLGDRATRWCCYPQAAYERPTRNSNSDEFRQEPKKCKLERCKRRTSAGRKSAATLFGETAAMAMMALIRFMMEDEVTTEDEEIVCGDCCVALVGWDRWKFWFMSFNRMKWSCYNTEERAWLCLPWWECVEMKRWNGIITDYSENSHRLIDDQRP